MKIKPWFRHLNKKVTEKPFAQMNYARSGFYTDPPPGSGQNVIGAESLYGQNFDIMDSDIPQTTIGDPPYKYPSLLSSKPSDVLAPKTNIQYQFLKNTPNPPQQLTGGDDERLGGQAYAVYRPDNDNLTRIEEDINYTNPYFMGPMMNLPPSVAGPIAVPKENLMNIPSPEQPQVNLDQGLPEEPPATMPEAITQGATGVPNMQVVGPDLSGAYNNAPEAQPPNAIPGVQFKAGKTMIDFTQPPTIAERLKGLQGMGTIGGVNNMPTDRFRTEEIPSIEMGINPPDEVDPNSLAGKLANLKGFQATPVQSNNYTGTKVPSPEDLGLVDSETGNTIPPMKESPKIPQFTENDPRLNLTKENELNKLANQDKNEEIAKEYAKTKGYSPEDYFKFKAILDSSALLNNLIQGPPPNFSLSRVHSPRMRMDRTGYEKQRTDAKEQASAAYRMSRTMGGQASNMLNSIAAITSNTQQNLRQVGQAEEEQALRTEQYNQQVAQQENAQNAQINNQEQEMNMNWQNQAKQAQNAAISQQLGRIGDTAYKYAAYQMSKQQAERAEKINRQDVNLANDIQLLMLQQNRIKEVREGTDYQTALAASQKQYVEDTTKNLIEDPAYKDLKDKYPNGMDYGSYQLQKKNYDALGLVLQNAQQALGSEPVMNEAGYEDETQDLFKERQDRYKRAKRQLTEQQKLYDDQTSDMNMREQFYNDLVGKFSSGGFKKDFERTYFANEGLKTEAELYEEIESLVSSARQE
jgi:hypothetical protein